jgi:hypothetical protein
LKSKVELVRHDPALMEGLLDDERLFQRLAESPEPLVRVSPWLLFQILLRRAAREMKGERYTVERVGIAQQAVVFDSHQVAETVGDPQVRDYLAEMLASFTKVHVTTVVSRRGNRIIRRRYSDMELDDLLEMASWVEREEQPRVYQRIGDLALFLLGIFPEHLERSFRYPLTGQPRLALWRRHRDPAEWQELGQGYYRRAAQEMDAAVEELPGVLAALAERFSLAKKSLNYVSRRYLCLSKFSVFQGNPS